MIGRFHSLETFGTVDGPGIRYVVFFQGCPMRCKFCHNPDSWETNAGIEKTEDEILDDYKRNEAFYKNGGITATGGEPLLQLAFLVELFTKAKERGINTCLDTSGGIAITENNKPLLAKLASVCDLIMLDIKHSDPDGYKDLTNSNQLFPLEFLSFMDERNVNIQIRHVLVPGITMNDEQLVNLAKLIAPYKSVRSLDVLPYHTMGVNKYESLGMKYPLEGVREASKEEAIRARNLIAKTISDLRNNKTV
ncbi:MAG: pyruvate formate-lyase-activating protein [Sphaerochaeta sp.]